MFIYQINICDKPRIAIRYVDISPMFDAFVAAPFPPFDAVVDVAIVLFDAFVEFMFAVVAIVVFKTLDAVVLDTTIEV